MKKFISVDTIVGGTRLININTINEIIRKRDGTCIINKENDGGIHVSIFQNIIY